MPTLSHPGLPLPSSLRHNIDRDFLDFLGERDGICDAQSWRLSKRKVAPVALPQSAHGDDLLRETLQRLYSGERYAVDLAAEKLRASGDPVEAYIAREERHHTELIAAAILQLGHTVPTHRPPQLMRPLLRAIVQLPHPLSTMFLFCGEYIGVLLILALRKRSSGLSVRPLVEEILTDEIGHLAFNHGKLTPLQLRVSQWILPWLLRLAAWREPLLRQLVPFRFGLMQWSILAVAGRGQAFVPGAPYAAVRLAPLSATG